jgi:F-type H+-transporting ATPase subunit gamma
MISGLEDLRRKLRGAEDLSAVTRAMKALAGVRIRQAREAVRALEEYGSTLELALQVILRDRLGEIGRGAEAAPRRTAVVVFGSDLGMAGPYNVRTYEHAAERIGSLEIADEDLVVLAVGERVAELAREDGRPVARRFATPESVSAITDTVQSLLLEIEALGAASQVDRVLLSYSHYHTGVTFRPHTLQLLPVNVDWLEGLGREPWRSTCIPTFRSDWEVMFRETVREHLFFTLFRAAAESFASENASRLASMQTAEKRIEEHVTELRRRYNREWQGSVTAELLDLLTGYEATAPLGGEPSS